MVAVLEEGTGPLALKISGWIKVLEDLEALEWISNSQSFLLSSFNFH
jgi:hypothetical protein